ncbi:MAG: hypothetical protein GVY04_13300 [Cyanobacteria bacterium]|jgi:hypothetical protein|nr:hypothetical protein [Cyanobacteria bacterium GSL.Bin1]
MSFISLINAAKAATTAARASTKFEKAVKISKGLWTTVEIADAGMDVFLIGNEIAKALGVTDPEIKALIDRVTEKGVEYDTMMSQVTQANTDITNLLAAITSLHGINDDFTERQGLAFEQIAALDSLKEKLNSSIPTTYTWFENTALLSNNLSDDSQDKLTAIQQQLGPNYMIIGLASSGLGLRAGFLGYSQYKKRESGANAPGADTSPNNMGVGSQNPEQLSDSQEAKKNRVQQVRSGITKYGSMMLRGVDKLVNVGSFGFSIFTLIQQQKAEAAIKRDLNEMLQDYESTISTYNFVLNGCKNADGSVNQEALEAVATEFDLVLEEETDEAIETLVIGYYGVLEEFDATVDDIVDSMDDAYESMIEQFKSVEIDSKDSQIVADLESSYDRFKDLKDIGKDENLAGDKRKTELDKIRDDFANSVAKQMKVINQELAVAIANHKSLSILEPFAQGIIDKWLLFVPSLPPSEKFIELEAATVKSTLDISFLERERFKTEEEIFEGLKQLIPELVAEESAEPALV